MNQLPAFMASYQRKIFYFLLLLLLFGSAALPSFAGVSNDSYETLLDKARTALDNADARSAYAAFAKARTLARKNQDREKENAFRDCLKKIPFYEVYFPLIEAAEARFAEKNYRDAQSGLLAAREQLDLSIAIGVDLPAFTQYEAAKRRTLDNRIAEIEAVRLPLIEEAIAKGEDLFLQNLPGEALEQFLHARDQMLIQSNESALYRIGERILKAELHYDIYTQLNLGRREAGYRRYREARQIYQDALAKVECSREYYFPRLEPVDLARYREVEELMDGLDDKRVKVREAATSRGQDYLEQDRPEAALDAFAYAKQQMFEERREYQTTGVDQLLPKGVGTGSIDFLFNTVLWMRPDCSLDWTVELYNAYGAPVGTRQVDGQCRFTFSGLPDGKYAYLLKLRESSGKTTAYQTESNEVIIQNGNAATVEIDAKGKQ